MGPIGPIGPGAIMGGGMTMLGPIIGGGIVAARITAFI